MAIVAPFRAIRYNSPAVGPMEQLVGPPYDLAASEDINRYRARHQCNVIRLLYPETTSGKPQEETASLLNHWLGTGYLARDACPAIYLYQIDYQLDNHSPRMTRTGFLALLRLQDYEMGVVRPHERTFSAVKVDRLAWLSACQVNLSQIFTFYDDPAQEVINTLQQAAPAQADLEFTDLEGITHRLWAVTDPQVHLRVARLLQGRNFYIADGHHRYETALAYRDLMVESSPRKDPRAPFFYTLVYAAPMQDPGLAILPAHRLITDLPGYEEEQFLAAVGRYFEIRDTKLAAGVPDHLIEFRSRLSALAGHKAFGFLDPMSPSLKLLVLKPEVLGSLQAHPALKDVDVVSLQEVIFRRCLGFTKKDFNNEKLFGYEYNPEKAVQQLLKGKARLGFFLNPTRVSQVKPVADAGLYMPRKSTLFYPKVSPGLVINPLLPGELAQDPLAW